MLPAEDQHVDLQVLRRVRLGSAGPLQAVHQFQGRGAAEQRVLLAPGDDQFPHSVRGGTGQRVAAGVDELPVGIAQRVGPVHQRGQCAAVGPAGRVQRVREVLYDGGAVPNGIRQRRRDGPDDRRSRPGEATVLCTVQQVADGPGRIGPERAVVGDTLRGERVECGLLALEPLFGSCLRRDVGGHRRVEQEPRHFVGVRSGIGQGDPGAAADTQERQGGHVPLGA
ncbi:Uncharacterised protein [Mycobacteroides abscessus subsp. abscessus]|nr:Uncharacterised protein [Mycobacteroides abscessus subsp. abscessus]